MSNKVQFISPQLNLSLFLVTRKRFKRYGPSPIREYILNNPGQYGRLCRAVEQSIKDEALQVEPDKCGCVNVWSKATPRPTFKVPDWSLPPSLYQPKTDESTQKMRQKVKFRITPSNVQKTINTPLFKPRSVFDHRITKEIKRRSVRFLKPTERIVVHSISNCYREPTEPGPQRYYARNHEISYRMAPKRSFPRPNPHQFLRKSTVPLNPRMLYTLTRHIRFSPSPFTYHVRSPECSCLSRKILEKQKRRKLAKQRRSKSPDKPSRKMYEKQIVRSDIPPTMTKEQYLFILANPRRKLISFTVDFIRMPREIPIRYNCLETTLTKHRRTIRHKKRMPFNSSADRFKYRPAEGIRGLTDLLRRLKRDEESGKHQPRRLRAKSVSRLSLKEVSAKLYTIPERWLAKHEVEMNRDFFRFSPLPEDKLLVTEADTRGRLANPKEKPNAYFHQPLRLIDCLYDDKRIDLQTRSRIKLFDTSFATLTKNLASAGNSTKYPYS